MITFCQANAFDGVDLDWEHPKGPAQQAAYTRLIVETKKAFTPVRLSLTAAIAGWQQLSPTAAQALDRIHLMSYDAQGKHSTLRQARQDIDRLRRAGIPAGRICLGLPFYGRSLDKKRTAYTYAEIVRRFAPASTADETNGIFFNGPATIRRKTRLAISSGLAGVSIWEIGQDARGPRSLLRVISESRRGPADRP
jgi:GH18 family chitinase